MGTNATGRRFHGKESSPLEAIRELGLNHEGAVWFAHPVRFPTLLTVHFHLMVRDSKRSVAE